MRTLHVGLRVADLDRSLAFYRAIGYERIGEVPETGIGHLVMLKLPADDFVTIELVHDPAGSSVGADTHLSHLVVQVDSMEEVPTPADVPLRPSCYPSIIIYNRVLVRLRTRYVSARSMT